MKAIRAFAQDSFDADDQDYTVDSDWADWDNRRLRYQLLWSYYASGVYNETVKEWARGEKASYGLYEHIRELYNPAYRIGEFYASKVWGGRLDIVQVDGRTFAGEGGALPIVTDSDRLREAIATLWRDSNWKTKRNLTPRRGAVLGDALIEVVNDAERQKVYLKSVHPAKVKFLDVDAFGNVKGYTLEYERTDDLNQTQKAVYTENVYREEETDNVVYELFKNGTPYAWGGDEPTWSLPYGFVPMVMVQHRDMGLDWGFSEAFPKLSLFREVDDQASKLNDQIRKIVDAQYVIMGAFAPSSVLGTTNTEPTANNPQAGRDESRMIYVTGEGVTMEPLVADLNIADALENIKFITEQMEKEFPELALAKMQSTVELSGVAVRRLQAEPKNKVVEVRDNYDDALVRAQQMAIAIGGHSNYDGYEGFGLDSYKNGDLNHQIGEREVFSRDQLDDLEIAKIQAETFAIVEKPAGASGAVELVPHLTEEQKDALTGGATVSPTMGL